MRLTCSVVELPCSVVANVQRFEGVLADNPNPHHNSHNDRQYDREAIDGQISRYDPQHSDYKQPRRDLERTRTADRSMSRI